MEGFHLFKFTSPLLCALGLLGILGMAGCSSLPTFVPDLSRRNGPPVQLEGAGGPLSAAQRKAVLERLQSRSTETSIFERHLALEEAIVGSPLTTGNQVDLLQDFAGANRLMAGFPRRPWLLRRVAACGCEIFSAAWRYLAFQDGAD